MLQEAEREALATPSFWHLDLPSSNWKDTPLPPDASEWSAKSARNASRAKKKQAQEGQEKGIEEKKTNETHQQTMIQAPSSVSKQPTGLRQ